MTRAKTRTKTRTRIGANRPAKSRTGSDEPLILVDESNRATGSSGKTAVHRAGLLHRAFSIFLVDDRGRLVLQQRSTKKYHSGGLWANSCCGHPRPGEHTVTAAGRRLREELGISARLSFGFFARYQAPLDNGMHENELVYVYFGRLTSEPRPDPAEVADVAALSCEEIGRRLKKNPKSFAFWFQHYFRKHGRDIVRLARRTARA
jgi:isopentenyl-diphosphate Delta-isomerase